MILRGDIKWHAVIVLDHVVKVVLILVIVVLVHVPVVLVIA